MAPLLHDDDTLYEALLNRDASFDGRVYVCVATTGIFCRLTCPSRKPRRENVSFFETAGQCLQAGFRPCKRCRPLTAGGGAPLVDDLMAAIEKAPGRVWSEHDLEQRGLDPSTVRRAFKRQFGITFLHMARLARLRQAATARKSGAAVIDAQLEAGFESASGFRRAFSHLLGRTPAAVATDGELATDFISTPLGPMIAIADSQKLCLLEFADRKELRREVEAVEKACARTISFGTNGILRQIDTELSAFFAGRRTCFSVPVMPFGTPFLRRVHEALRQIEPGETLSYSELATRIGRPTAMRAVARANAANRLAIIVPCHRVIGADGAPCGYAGGVWRKRWLLDHEHRIRHHALARGLQDLG